MSACQRPVSCTSPKVISLVIFFFLASPFLANSQIQRYGDSIQLKGQKVAYKLLENGEILVQRSWNDQFYFDHFSSDLKLKNHWEYKLKSGMNQSESLVGIEFDTAKFFMFIQKEQGGKKRHLIRYNMFERSDVASLFTAKGTKGESPKLHYFYHSELKLNILWYESLNHPFKKQKRVHILSFNGDDEIQWADSFVLEDKDRLIDIRKIKVNEHGDYELILRKFRTNRAKVRHGKPNYEFWHAKIQTGAPHMYTKLLSRERFYTGLKIRFTDDSWQIRGLYSKKFKRRDGLFTMVFKGGSVQLNLMDKLPAKIGRELSPLGLKNRLDDLVLDHHFARNEFTYWVSEEFTYKLKGTPTSPSYELTYGAILIVKTDAQNNIVDWQVIRKKQRMNSRYKYFASYQIIQDDTGFSIVLNPSDKILIRKKTYDYAERKEHPGFYIFRFDDKHIDLQPEEQYYPIDEKSLPLIGSVQIKKDRLKMIMVERHGRFYLPVSGKMP